MSKLRLTIEDFFSAEPCQSGVELDFMPYWGMDTWKVPRWNAGTYGDVLPNHYFKPPPGKYPRKYRKWLYYDEYAPWICWLLGAGQKHLPRRKNWVLFFEDAFRNNPKNLEYMSQMPLKLQQELVYWAVMKIETHPEILYSVMYTLREVDYYWYVRLVEQGYFPIWDRRSFRQRIRAIAESPKEHQDHLMAELRQDALSHIRDWCNELEPLYHKNVEAWLQRCFEEDLRRVPCTK